MIQVCDLYSSCTAGYMIAVEFQHPRPEGGDAIIAIQYYHGMTEIEAAWLHHLLRHWGSIGYSGALNLLINRPLPGTVEHMLSGEDYGTEEEAILSNLGLQDGMRVAYDIVECFFLEEDTEDLYEHLMLTWRDYVG